MGTVAPASPAWPCGARGCCCGSSSSATMVRSRAIDSFAKLMTGAAASCDTVPASLRGTRRLEADCADYLPTPPAALHRAARGEAPSHELAKVRFEPLEPSTSGAATTIRC